MLEGSRIFSAIADSICRTLVLNKWGKKQTEKNSEHKRKYLDFLSLYWFALTVRRSFLHKSTKSHLNTASNGLQFWCSAWRQTHIHIFVDYLSILNSKHFFKILPAQFELWLLMINLQLPWLIWLKLYSVDSPKSYIMKFKAVRKQTGLSKWNVIKINTSVKKHQR